MILQTNSGNTSFEVDDVDFEEVSKYRWHYQRYLRTSVNGKVVRLHNLIFGKPFEGLEWDHIDRNPLNNKRSNLRVVSKSENLRNRGISKNNVSGHKGVCWHSRCDKWIAQIKIDGKIRHLGYFKDIDEAVRARKAAETLYW